MSLNEFKWYDGDTCSTLYLLKEFDENLEIGIMFGVDISYQQNLQNSHNKLPYLPTRECPPDSKVSKLLTILNGKTNYPGLLLSIEASFTCKIKNRKNTKSYTI